jgi:hypothetical protein
MWRARRCPVVGLPRSFSVYSTESADGPDAGYDKLLISLGAGMLNQTIKNYQITANWHAGMGEVYQARSAAGARGCH